MYPSTDIPLRKMAVTTKEEAVTYLRAYKQWIIDNSSTGNGAFIGAKSKPATVRSPDLSEKARIAEELAEQCYWQMPYDLAKRKFFGIPYAKWSTERTKRNLPLTQ